jgi:hypothetical protein
VVAAHLIAERTCSAQLLTSANSAYVHGMGVVLLVSGVAALAAALPAGTFLPNNPTRTGTAPPTPTPRAPPATPDMAPDLASDRPDGRQ